MEVKLISREIIKPSSPTPPHLRTYKLSLFDQIAMVAYSAYIPIVLFYSDASGDLKKRSNVLKESLSKTLTHFYPFAGRVRDSFSIDCNDEGVIYKEAQVATNMSAILKEAEIDLLQPLLPCDPLERFPEPSANVMVAIQVSFFACGGMAISTCVNHVVADASAMSTFLEIWALAACGANYIDDIVIYDTASVFPPRDLFDVLKKIMHEYKDKFSDQTHVKLLTKRLLFDGSKVASLREEIGNELCSYRPSRFEAVSALIWSATAENNETFPMVGAMNLRNRMNPALPRQCVGNVIHGAMVEPHMEKTINRSILARKIHESIKKVDDKYVRNLYGDNNGYLDILRSGINNKPLAFSSWCRFPFYEVDFGWGKPIWIAAALKFNRGIIFLDAKDGEGIEAWITLTEKEMAKFEQDHDILAYTSLKESI